MDDRKLEHLLKLALEAEEFERFATQPVLGVVGTRRRSWLLPVAGLTAAAAAVLAIVTVVVPAISPASPQKLTQGPSGGAPTRLESTVNGEFDKPIIAKASETEGSAQGSVVLAFFEGFDGKCTCLHMQTEDWDSNQLAEKGRAELLDVAYRSRCSGPAPKMLVVGISGKLDELPKTVEQAEALAAQLRGHPTMGSRTDLVNYAYESVRGLPAGSTIVAEAVGTHNGILEQAKFSMR